MSMCSWGGADWRWGTSQPGRGIKTLDLLFRSVSSCSILWMSYLHCGVAWFLFSSPSPEECQAASTSRNVAMRSGMSGRERSGKDTIPGYVVLVVVVTSPRLLVPCLASASQDCRPPSPHHPKQAPYRAGTLELSARSEKMTIVLGASLCANQREGATFNYERLSKQNY